MKVNLIKSIREMIDKIKKDLKSGKKLKGLSGRMKKYLQWQKNLLKIIPRHFFAAEDRADLLSKDFEKNLDVVRVHLSKILQLFGCSQKIIEKFDFMDPNMVILFYSLFLSKDKMEKDIDNGEVLKNNEYYLNLIKKDKKYNERRHRSDIVEYTSKFNPLFKLFLLIIVKNVFDAVEDDKDFRMDPEKVS